MGLNLRIRPTFLFTFSRPVHHDSACLWICDSSHQDSTNVTKSGFNSDDHYPLIWWATTTTLITSKRSPFNRLILKNCHDHFYFDFNISNGRRQVSMNLDSRWMVFICRTVHIRLNIFSRGILVQFCSSDWRLAVPGGLFMWRTSWQLAKAKWTYSPLNFCSQCTLLTPCQQQLLLAEEW